MDTPPPKKPLPKFIKGTPFPALGGTALFVKKTEEKSGPLPIFSQMKASPAPRSGTLVGRLKGLKPHELAFVAAGFAIIVIAPLIEYLISTPGDSAGTLKSGFAERGGGPIFPEGSTPYEGGLGIAQGDLVGAAKDIVTPLGASKDPLSMIMRLAGAENAPTSEVPPAEKKEEKKEEAPPPSESWKDAITAAKSAVTNVVKKTPGMPRPTERLTATLKGLGGGSGGAGSTSGPSQVSSSASVPIKLEPPSSQGLVGTPRKDSALTRVSPTAGFRGGARGLASGGGGGGGQAGRGGPSIGAPGGLLQETNALLTSGGGRGSTEGNQASKGDSSGNPVGNTSKDTKTTTITPQENLNLLRQKMEMEKAISLKYDKKRYDQLDRKKMLEQIAAQTLAQTAQQAFLKILDKLLGNNPNQQQKAQQQQQQAQAPPQNPVQQAQQNAPQQNQPQNVQGQRTLTPQSRLTSEFGVPPEVAAALLRGVPPQPLIGANGQPVLVNGQPQTVVGAAVTRDGEGGLVRASADGPNGETRQLLQTANPPGWTLTSTSRPEDGTLPAGAGTFQRTTSLVSTYNTTGGLTGQVRRVSTTYQMADGSTRAPLVEETRIFPPPP